MRRSMFFKLMVMFTAVILLCVLLLLAVFILSYRETQINNRMSALKSQAYDIAYLAGTPARLTFQFPLGLTDDPTRVLMEYKLRAVYEEYDAYCLVLDRGGRVTSYFSSVLEEHQELKSNFDPDSIVDTFARVLSGEEVIAQTRDETGPMFTVAVPWVENNAVYGAVYIRTAAQAVHSAYAGLWTKAGIAALAAFVAAAAIAFYYTRRLMKPLEEIAKSAALMEKGQPVPLVSDGGVRELNELSLSFNHMAKQIQDTEETRRAFIANLSHELRSPMTSIQGFIQGMLDGVVKPEDTKQTLSIVLQETKRLAQLVNGLFTLSRAEAPEQEWNKEVFDLCEVTRLVLITRLFQAEEKNLSVETRFEHENMYASAVKNQIEQVLINLLDNAIRFTPTGGEITLSIRERDKKTLAVTVRDNGIGVLPEDAGRIFERFYKGSQAHSPGEGAGLGLAISKTIMEKHGHTLRLLQDEPGAAFMFTLDRAEKPDVKPHAD